MQFLLADRAADKSLQEDLAFFSAPESYKEKLSDAGVYELLPENVEALHYFSLIWPQFIVDHGRIWGFNYVALFAIFDLYKVQNRIELFEDIKIMEAEAVRILNKRA